MSATSTTLVSATDGGPVVREGDPDIPYLAGFFDGEGMFRYQNSPEARVSNTDLEIIACYWRRWGGSITRVEQSNPKWRTQYIWSVCGDAALAAIQDLLPYLREKRAQADLVLLMRTLKPWERDEPRAELSRLKRIDSRDKEGTILR